MQSWLDMLTGKSAFVAVVALLAISVMYTNYAISNYAPFLSSERSIIESIKSNRADIVDLKLMQKEMAQATYAVKSLIEKHDARIANLSDFQQAQIREQLRRSPIR